MSYRSEKRAFEDFYSIQSPLKKSLKEEKEKRKEDEKKEKQDFFNFKPVVFNKKDLETIFSAHIQKYQDFINKNKNKKASILASLELGELYFNAKDFPSVKNILLPLEPMIEDKSEVLAYLFLNLLGSTFMELKKWNQALTYFKKILKNKNNSYLHPNVLLKIGLCYENLNQKEKAAQQYKDLIKKFPKSSLIQKARSYLNLMLVNEKS